MFAVQRPKGEEHMSRHENMVAKLIRYFGLLMLFLMVGGQVAAQTASESADKIKVSAPSIDPADAPPFLSSSPTDRSKRPASSAKPETDLMNARADIKSQP